jgi:hypothetical protein
VAEFRFDWAQAQGGCADALAACALGMGRPLCVLVSVCAACGCAQRLARIERAKGHCGIGHWAGALGRGIGHGHWAWAGALGRWAGAGALCARVRFLFRAFSLREIRTSKIFQVEFLLERWALGASVAHKKKIFFANSFF